MKRCTYAVAFAFAFAYAALAGAPASALTCYPQISAGMIDTVTSKSGFSGQVFRFRILATATSQGKTFPKGAVGYGVVLQAIPASNHARNGIVVLEPRYVTVNDAHYQVAGNPRDASILTHQASVLNRGLGAVPIPGVGFAANEAIQGSDITIGPGYTFHIVPIGDLQQRGPCVQP